MNKDQQCKYWKFIFSFVKHGNSLIINGSTWLSNLVQVLKECRVLTAHIVDVLSVESRSRRAEHSLNSGYTNILFTPSGNFLKWKTLNHIFQFTHFKLNYVYTCTYLKLSQIMLILYIWRITVFKEYTNWTVGADCILTRWIKIMDTPC